MGLVFKYEERNAELPKHRQNLMAAIELDLMNDKNILAIFYGGSIGNEDTDLFSDIDLRIVVKDEFFEDYRLNKTDRAKNWGDVLFFEDFPWANYSTAHYKEFIKVDSFYYKLEDIKPSPWLQKLKIVKDSNCYIENVVEQSQAIIYSPTRLDIEQWRTKFYAHLHEAYRRVMRNEIYYALKCIDYLRLSIINGWFMEQGIQPNTLGDWAKLEGERTRLTNQQLSLLTSWHCNREQQAILNVMQAIVPAFLKSHKTLCEKHNIEENNELVTSIVNMVI